jgi:ATP-dependent DNA helicase RecG
MNNQELQNYLLKTYGKTENSTLEWKDFSSLKHAVNGDKKNDIISYISAFANNEGGFLIIGVEDKTCKITGIKNFNNYTMFNICEKLGHQLTNNPEITLEEYISVTSEIVWVFKIGKCPPRQITYAHREAFYRDGDNLVGLPDWRKNEILNQDILSKFDWSAQACEGATINDLDLEAVEIARNGFIVNIKNNPEEVEIVKKFDTIRFLQEAKMLTKNGEITNSALLLLGNKSARTKLGCGFASEISYLERTFKNDEEFHLPFQKAILAVVDKISIKNIEIKITMLGEYTGNNAILPNYYKPLLRECIANCVAHQDYSKHQRIEIYETIHQNIEFKNAGSCIYTKEEFEKIQLRVEKPTRYRNEFLAEAMRQIGLMEAKGTGHWKIYNYNIKQVYLPLPKIDWNDTEKFAMTIYGAPLDEKFAKILQTQSDLEPQTILLLDQVQKARKLSPHIYKNLKKLNLIEGKPSDCRLSLDLDVLVSGAIAISNNQKRNNFDPDKIIKNVYDFIKNCNEMKVNVTIQNVFEHIKDEITIKDSEKKKLNYFNNVILVKMKTHNKYKITNQGSRTKPIWQATILL